MWDIHFYEDHRGNRPVLDFINSLNHKEKAKVNNVLRLLEEFGTDLGTPDRGSVVGITCWRGSHILLSLS